MTEPRRPAHWLTLAIIRRDNIAGTIQLLRHGIAAQGDFFVPVYDLMASMLLPDLEAEHQEMVEYCASLLSEVGGMQ